MISFCETREKCGSIEKMNIIIVGEKKASVNKKKVRAKYIRKTKTQNESHEEQTEKRNTKKKQQDDFCYYHLVKPSVPNVRNKHKIAHGLYVTQHITFT